MESETVSTENLSSTTEKVDTTTTEQLVSTLITTTITAETPTSVPVPTSPVKLEKISVLLKPVGDAPILKQKLWTVDQDKPVSGIIQFVKKLLKFENDSSVFVFVNQSFAPCPDHLIRNLYECFGSDGKLVLHYSTTIAWG